jgi:hypothetical protein
MSTPENEPDVPTDPADEQDLGGLSVEDDPDGTVDPADLAGTASDDDEDVS